MTKIDFYALSLTAPEIAATKVISKAGDLGKKILARLENAAYAKAFDNYLWTYDPKEFISHGLITNEEKPLEQVLIGEASEMVVGVDYLLLLNNASFEGFEKFERVFWFFNHFDQDIAKKAQDLRDLAKNQGVEVNWWLQNDKGAYTKSE